MQLCTAGAERRPDRRFLRGSVAASIVAASALTLGVPCIAVELFGPWLSLRTGAGPSHAVQADFDGNGIADIAVTNFGDGTVTILLADGLGGFDTAPQLELRSSPVSVATGDFDADGAADLAVAHLVTDTLSILLGDGGGGFSFAGEVATGIEPSFVAAGDFDFDGRTDLAVVSSAEDTVTVLSSDGHSGFTATAEIPVGQFPRSIVVADLTADGFLDLAVANWLSSSIDVLLGDGLGGFVAAEEILVGTDRGPSSIAVEDFDRDGAADLAVANTWSDSVAIYLGDGTGRFEAAQEIPQVGDSPVWLVADDFDDDGSVDLAVTNYLGNTVSVLRGDPEGLANGSGGFVKTDEVAVQEKPRSSIAADFTGDGAVDLAVVLAVSDLVTVLRGDGLGAFTPVRRVADALLSQAWDGHWAYSGLALADFDQDGHVDLAVTSPGENALNVYRGDGRGNYLDRETIEVDDLAPTALAVDDFDGDGDADLAVTSSLGSGGRVQILHGDGRGGFSEGQLVRVGGGRLWCVVSGDFDLDGNADLAVTDFDNRLVRVIAGHGDGSFADSRDMDVGDGPTAAAVADFDSDGTPDLAVTNHRSDWVSIHPGLAGLPGQAVRIDSPEDIAGDYPARPATFGRSLPATGIAGFIALVNDGYGMETDGCEPLSGDLEGRIALADLSDECLVATTVKHAQEAGAVAVIVAHNKPDDLPDMDWTVTGVTIPSVGISMAHGDTIKTALPGVHASLLDLDLQQGRRVPVGWGPTSIAAGNFDGDGHVDLAVANGPGDSISILTGDGRGGFTETQRIPVGDWPNSVAVADLNLDGLDDIAFVLAFDDSAGALVSDGRGGFAATPLFHSGWSPTVAAVADFDEDGAPDLAVANYLGESVSLFSNRIADRVDPNGSNRVDGFDLAQIARLSGVGRESPDYRRTHDVDLNGLVDGDDLALVASRFGELMKRTSPLRARLEDPPAPEPNTITLQPRRSEGSRLTVDLLIDDDDDPTSSAEFKLRFEPTEKDADTGQVLEAVGFEPGNYFAGGLTQVYRVDTRTPGEAQIRITRLPVENRAGTGRQRLLSLILEARRPGTALLEFLPVEGRAAPSLLDDAGNEVAGVLFRGGVIAQVDTSPDAAPGQKAGFAPARLDFGAVPVGVQEKRMLRLTNFGFSNLEVLDVVSTLPQFASFFATRFTIPPYGSVQLPVQFAPTAPGVYAGEMILQTDDPQRPAVRAPVLGRSELSVSVTPTFVTFGDLDLGSSSTRKIGIGNRGNAPLILSAVAVSHADFVVRFEFTALDPGEFGVVEVEFRPTSAGDVHGLLSLSFDGTVGRTVVLTLTGFARAGP